MGEAKKEGEKTKREFCGLSNGGWDCRRKLIKKRERRERKREGGDERRERGSVRKVWRLKKRRRKAEGRQGCIRDKE